MGDPRHRARNSSLPRKLYHFFRDRSPAEIVDAVRTHGFLRLAWNALPGHLIDRRFDRRHGVQTSGSVYLHEVDVVGDRATGHIYDTMSARTTRAVVGSAPADAGGWTFIDFGSGKGRVLLVAAERPFARVVGVEFARELHEIAQANVRSYRNPRRRCARIEPVLADATTVPIPPGPLVLHFFSPFEPPVLRAVLDNIARAYREDPRPMVLIYMTDPDSYPIPFELFAETVPFLVRGADPRIPRFDPARRFHLAGAVFVTPGAA